MRKTWLYWTHIKNLIIANWYEAKTIWTIKEQLLWEKLNYVNNADNLNPNWKFTIAAVTKNAAIDLMYSGGPKTRRNRRHIAAVFAPAAIGPPQLLVFLVVLVAGGPYSNTNLHDFQFPKQANKWLFFPKQQYNIHISGPYKSSLLGNLDSSW